jgi:hypothetical protein
VKLSRDGTTLCNRFEKVIVSAVVGAAKASPFGGTCCEYAVLRSIVSPFGMASLRVRVRAHRKLVFVRLVASIFHQYFARNGNGLGSLMQWPWRSAVLTTVGGV